MNKKKSKYKKFTALIIKKIRKARILKFLSKYSKKPYSIWQHLVLLTFRQMLSLSYREFISWLENSKLLVIPDLKSIPQFTTLHKFTKRAHPAWLRAVVSQAISLTKIHKLIICIDSTGFSYRYGSSYYCDRTIVVKKRTRWIKLSIAADAKTQLILNSKIKMTPSNDYQDLMPLLSNLKDKNISYVCADKGYDSKTNHEYLTKQLKTRSLIAVRNTISSHNRKTIRKKIAKNFNKKLYHQRSKAETIFSVIKRVYGSTLKSKKFYMRAKEILFKIIAYNTTRLLKITIILIKDFYKADSTI